MSSRSTSVTSSDSAVEVVDDYQQENPSVLEFPVPASFLGSSTVFENATIGDILPGLTGFCTVGGHFYDVNSVFMNGIDANDLGYINADRTSSATTIDGSFDDEEYDDQYSVMSDDSTSCRSTGTSTSDSEMMRIVADMERQSGGAESYPNDCTILGRASPSTMPVVDTSDTLGSPHMEGEPVVSFPGLSLGGYPLRMRHEEVLHYRQLLLACGMNPEAILQPIDPDEIDTLSELPRSLSPTSMLSVRSEPGSRRASPSPSAITISLPHSAPPSITFLPEAETPFRNNHEQPPQVIFTEEESNHGQYSLPLPEELDQQESSQEQPAPETPQITREQLERWQAHQQIVAQREFQEAQRRRQLELISQSPENCPPEDLGEYYRLIPNPLDPTTLLFFKKIYHLYDTQEEQEDEEEEYSTITLPAVFHAARSPAFSVSSAIMMSESVAAILAERGGDAATNAALQASILEHLAHLQENRCLEAMAAVQDILTRGDAHQWRLLAVVTNSADEARRKKRDGGGDTEPRPRASTAPPPSHHAVSTISRRVVSCPEILLCPTRQRQQSLSQHEVGHTDSRRDLYNIQGSPSNDSTLSELGLMDSSSSNCSISSSNAYSSDNSFLDGNILHFSGSTSGLALVNSQGYAMMGSINSHVVSNNNNGYATINFNDNQFFMGEDGQLMMTSNNGHATVQSNNSHLVRENCLAMGLSNDGHAMPRNNDRFNTNASNNGHSMTRNDGPTRDIGSHLNNSGEPLSSNDGPNISNLSDGEGNNGSSAADVGMTDSQLQMLIRNLDILLKNLDHNLSRNNSNSDQEPCNNCENCRRKMRKNNGRPTGNNDSSDESSSRMLRINGHMHVDSEYSFVNNERRRQDNGSRFVPGHRNSSQNFGNNSQILGNNGPAFGNGAPTFRPGFGNKDQMHRNNNAMLEDGLGRRVNNNGPTFRNNNNLRSTGDGHRVPNNGLRVGNNGPIFKGNGSNTGPMLVRQNQPMTSLGDDRPMLVNDGTRPSNEGYRFGPRFEDQNHMRFGPRFQNQEPRPVGARFQQQESRLAGPRFQNQGPRSPGLRFQDQDPRFSGLRFQNQDLSLPGPRFQNEDLSLPGPRIQNQDLNLPGPRIQNQDLRSPGPRYQNEELKLPGQRIPNQGPRLAGPRSENQGTRHQPGFEDHNPRYGTNMPNNNGPSIGPSRPQNNRTNLGPSRHENNGLKFRPGFEYNGARSPGSSMHEHVGFKLGPRYDNNGFRFGPGFEYKSPLSGNTNSFVLQRPGSSSGNNGPSPRNSSQNVLLNAYSGPNVPPIGNSGPKVLPTGYSGPNVPPTGYSRPNVPPTAGYSRPNVPPTAGYSGPNVPPTGNNKPNSPLNGNNSGPNGPSTGNNGPNGPPTGSDGPHSLMNRNNAPNGPPVGYSSQNGPSAAEHSGPKSPPTGTNGPHSLMNRNDGPDDPPAGHNGLNGPATAGHNGPAGPLAAGHERLNRPQSGSDGQNCLPTRINGFIGHPPVGNNGPPPMGNNRPPPTDIHHSPTGNDATSNRKNAPSNRNIGPNGPSIGNNISNSPPSTINGSYPVKNDGLHRAADINGPVMTGNFITLLARNDSSFPGTDDSRLGSLSMNGTMSRNNLSSIRNDNSFPNNDDLRNTSSRMGRRDGPIYLHNGPMSQSNGAPTGNHGDLIENNIRLAGNNGSVPNNNDLRLGIDRPAFRNNGPLVGNHGLMMLGGLVGPVENRMPMPALPSRRQPGNNGPDITSNSSASQDNNAHTGSEQNYPSSNNSRRTSGDSILSMDGCETDHNCNVF